jgi:hypothetical protein
MRRERSHLASDAQKLCASWHGKQQRGRVIVEKKRVRRRNPVNIVYLVMKNEPLFQSSVTQNIMNSMER